MVPPQRRRKESLVLFFDDECAICRAAAAHIRRRDWRSHVRLLPLRDAAGLAHYDIPLEKAQARLHAVLSNSGQRVEGIDALYEVAKRLPLWWPSVPLLWLATKLGFGQALYDAFAARRLRISHLVCGGSCPLPDRSEPSR